MTPLIGGSEATGSIAFEYEWAWIPSDGYGTHTRSSPRQLYEAFGELTIFFILVMWAS